MTANYTSNSVREIRYTVVQISDTAPGLDLPNPSRVPQVAQDKIPDQHRGPTSADGDYQIVIRHESEDDPLEADVDWVGHEALREHKRKNRDIWEGDNSV